MDSVDPIAAGLLRRLDWRYLVPGARARTFDRMALLGADSALLDAVVRSGLATTVTTTLGEYDADLVAVLSPAGVDPERIVRAVRPGGVLYVEVDRWRSGSRGLTPHRLADRLREHGASIDAQYALRPTPEMCELFVPLDESGALDWFLSNVYVATTPTKLIGEIAMRKLLGSNSRRIARVAPFHATIATLPPSGATVLPRSTVAAGRNHSIAMIIHGGSRVVQVAFSDEHYGVPQFVTKIPKQEQSAQRTGHEQVNVHRIRDLLGPGARESLPRPHQLIEFEAAMPVAIEDAAAGYSLARSCGRWGRPLRTKIDDLRLATSWLIGLHRDHAIGRDHWDDERQTEVIEQQLAAFATRFIVSTEQAELFEATRAAARALSGLPLPLVWEHGDFTIWNMFRHGYRMRILDWEYCKPGVPLADMLRLATHWHEAVCDLTTPEMRYRGFVDLFGGSDTTNPATIAARTAIQRYEAALGLDARFRSIILVMSRVELAVRRYEQQRNDGMVTADGQGNAALGYLASLVPRRTSLFATAEASGSLQEPSAVAGS